MSGFEVDTKAYRSASALLKHAPAELRKAYTKALRDVAKPYGKYVLVAGAQKLPRKGGLQYRVASARVGTTVSTLKAGVTLSTREGYDLKAMDTGKLRHPTFGKEGWVEQDIPDEVFTTPFKENGDQVRSALVAAGQAVLDQAGGFS